MGTTREFMGNPSNLGEALAYLDREYRLFLTPLGVRRIGRLTNGDEHSIGAFKLRYCNMRFGAGRIGSVKSVADIWLMITTADSTEFLNQHRDDQEIK